MIADKIIASFNLQKKIISVLEEDSPVIAELCDIMKTSALKETTVKKLSAERLNKFNEVFTEYLLKAVKEFYEEPAHGYEKFL